MRHQQCLLLEEAAPFVPALDQLTHPTNGGLLNLLKPRVPYVYVQDDALSQGGVVGAMQK